jgi:hypothetical protein
VGDVSIEVRERVPLRLPMKCKVRRGWGEVANCNVDISEEGVVLMDPDPQKSGMLI